MDDASKESKKDSEPRNNNEKPKDATKFTCPTCGETKSRKDSLKRHHLSAHKTPIEDVDTVFKTECLHPTCHKRFFHKTKMLQHLEEDHDMECVKTQHTFHSNAEFLEWKEKEELTAAVYFSKQNGDRAGSATQYSYYVCQRDGSGAAHRSSEEPGRTTDRRNVKGRVKDGTCCPARIIAHRNLTSGEVRVNYIRTHSHQPTFHDTQHHPIPQSIKREIKGKLALGVPTREKRKDLPERLAERGNRENVQVGQLRACQFLTRKRVYEMCRKPDKKRRLHPDDSKSTHLLVSRLQEEKYNPVLLYKPLGKDVIIGDQGVNKLPKCQELFALGIQTKEQLEMMHNKQIICIDTTHGTNLYEYSLLNLIVPDEFGKGYPVGHLISNHQDKDTLHFFFLEMKKRAPDLKIGVIMSDDDYSGPNAIKSVFGENIRHILCKWHLHRAWQRRLRQDITNDDKLVNEVYQVLMLILEEPNTNRFEELVAAFKEKYTPLCKTFVDHFFSRYMNRTEAWAMCHRKFPHSHADSNMFVEAFHNRLKMWYMNSQPTRRVDDLINLLLTIEEEDYSRHLGDIQYHAPEADKTKPETNETRNKRGLKIPDSSHFTFTDVPMIENTPEERASSGLLERAKQDVKTLMDTLEDEETVRSLLPFICGNLRKMLARVDAVKNARQPPLKQMEKVFIAPNQK